MNFPTPKGHDPEKFKSNKPKVRDEQSDSEPSFPDDMGQAELKAAITKYQEWCNDHYDELDVDLDGIPVEISTKMKRTAGKVKWINGSDQVKLIRYAFKAYQKWGWEEFAKTIRHELIHVHTVQNYSKGGHGRLFKRFVDPLNTHQHCETFAENEAKYILRCSDCVGVVAYRHKRSKTVKNPEKYRSKCCNASLQVEHNRSK
jgi:predicted SprT family Zn-dependent metalloprotease